MKRVLHLPHPYLFVYFLKISAYNTAKERLAKQEAIEGSPPMSDIPHIYKDEAVDLETGEINPESEKMLHDDRQSADEDSSRQDKSGPSDTEKLNNVAGNGNIVTQNDQKNSSPNAESTPENESAIGSSS